MGIRKRIQRIILLGVLCAETMNVSAQIQVKNTLWEGAEFLHAPSYRVVNEDSIQSLVFESLPYRGCSKSVFAYYATPGMLGHDRAIDKKLPGVILVHGGGGMAFREWVIMWAKRGYAALALDTRGNGADKKPIVGGFDEGGKETPYFDVTLPQKEQWIYQAVGDIINAHSLMLSFPEVDKARTAITGISWGGVLTCIASSLDARFQVAVPVYGCGFLSESGRMKNQLDALTTEQRNRWMEQYDPAVFLSRMNRPILFVNGTNDVHFYLPSMARSASLVKDSRLLIKQGLRHSHKYGWSSEEIGAFIDQYLCGGKSLPIIKKMIIKGDMVQGEITSSVPLKSVILHYTTDTGQVREEFHWSSVEADLHNHSWSVSLPKGATTWYVNVTDNRGCQTSGPVHW